MDKHKYNKKPPHCRKTSKITQLQPQLWAKLKIKHLSKEPGKQHQSSLVEKSSCWQHDMNTQTSNQKGKQAESWPSGGEGELRVWCQQRNKPKGGDAC